MCLDVGHSWVRDEREASTGGVASFFRFPRYPIPTDQRNHKGQGASIVFCDGARKQAPHMQIDNCVNFPLPLPSVVGWLVR